MDVATTRSKVEVPKVDDETFKAFFQKATLAKQSLEEKVEVTVDDFDHVFMESNDM